MGKIADADKKAGKYGGSWTDYYETIGEKRRAARKVANKNLSDINSQIYSNIQNDVAPTAITSSYTESPELRANKQQTLNELLRVYQGGGFTPEDQAAIDLGNMSAAREARGAREAAMSQAQARGLSGSAIELANVQRANEAAGGRQYEGARQNQITARQRALDALIQRSGLSSTLSEEDRNTAQARDAMNMFNQQNLQNWKTNRNNQLLGYSQMLGSSKKQKKAAAGNALNAVGDTAMTGLDMYLNKGK